jgi:hypothetical protein
LIEPIDPLGGRAHTLLDPENIMMNKHAFAIVALVAALFVLPPAAQAQVKPFKVNGGGTAPLGTSVFGFDSPHDATGNGTHLGKYSGNEGNFNSLSFDPDTLSGTFEGSFVFVAANGDRLACTYGDTDNAAASAGFYFAVPSAELGKFNIIFCAEFNPILDECTGRFEGLTAGSFIMLAMTEPVELELDDNGFTPPFEYTWDGKGTLTFAKGNK